MAASLINYILFLEPSMAPNLVDFIWFWNHPTKPYKSIGFGAVHGSKSYKFIGFWGRPCVQTTYVYIYV